MPMNSSIHMTQQAYNELLSLCQEALPNEACGILTAQDDESVVIAAKSITNVHPTPQRAFSFDPVEWTAAFYDMQKNRQKIVGFFHSHPASEAVPSIYDETGFWPADHSVSYWIVSMLNRDKPFVQPYRRDKLLFQPLTLVLA